ncbi:putative protein TPRXL [Amphibalanus amphitrite]|nr:putative protein TPRXL [Amphibalanus amphitrite]
MDILTGSNQVINPEYVSPLETKESPLSLLAKTCSNIGMDQPSRLTPASKPAKEDSAAKSSSPPASSPSSSTSRTSESRNHSRRSPPTSSQGPTSQTSSQAGSRSKVSFKPYESVTSPSAAERGKSRSPAAKATSPRPAAAAVVTSSPATSPSEKESPKPATSYLSPYGLGSPLDALYLRSGLPPSACRDPLCKGCLPGLCPTGCLHCKTLSALPGTPSPLGLGLYPPPGLVGGLQPYCCNWSEAGTYCGKRFNSSDELMQHLRGHTAADATVLPSPLGLMLPRAPYSAASALSPLASLAAGRYHPYAKPGLTPSLAPSLPPSLAPSLATPSSLALYPYLANPYLYAGLRR